MREHGEAEVFSNPLPPESHHHQHEEDDEHPLTNDDFRKLLMTPGGPVSSTSSTKPSESHDRTHSRTTSSHTVEPTPGDEEDDAATRRRKKKSYYAKLKKIEDERQKELDKKYRDRARERREGANTDYDTTESISTTADYRAVAPDAMKMGENYAERRKIIIQESKYLGGDMEHTHLVKGLDFALLEKVRAEITSKEIHEDQIEEYLSQAIQQQNKKQEKEEDPENFIEFRTKMARNIFRVACKARGNERNELFLPGRMAYVVDLEDEYADSDIPTTLIRSKADCISSESTTIMSTNDMVINKLTQILTYLRQGKRDRKKLKKDKGKKEEERLLKEKLAIGDESIYPDPHYDYTMIPGRDAPASSRVKREPRDETRDGRRDEARDNRRDERRDRPRERGRDEREGRDRDRIRDQPRDRLRDDRDRKRKSYFEKPAEEDESRDHVTRQTTKDLVQSINEKFNKGGWPDSADQRQHENKPVKKEEERMKKIKKRMEIDSYAECYPGMEESADAVIDSDDEADYTKMDMGNKKGPVGRWDFESQEDYSNYMSTKEALPKAAFQYGVKMADGRKTRRAGPKDEKAQLDRQWQKIQNIIQKRKSDVPGDRGGKSSKR